MNIYKAIFQPYERFESPAPRTIRFEAPNDKLALLKAGPFYGWGCGRMEDDPDEEMLKEELNVPLEDMVEVYKQSNGDGTDFLFLLKNEDTGEVIFEDGDYTDCDDTVEEWDENWISEEILEVSQN